MKTVKKKTAEPDVEPLLKSGSRPAANGCRRRDMPSGGNLLKMAEEFMPNNESVAVKKEKDNWMGYM